MTEAQERTKRILLFLSAAAQRRKEQDDASGYGVVHTLINSALDRWEKKR